MFVVEEAEGRGYKKIHKEGCRDVRDPEILGQASELEQLFLLCEQYGYGDATNIDEMLDMMCPCAKESIR